MGIKIIIVAIIVVVVILYIGNAVWNEVVSQHDLEHSTYCSNWLNRIDTSKNNTGMFTGDSQLAQLNAEINQYNHECVSGS